MFTDTRERLEQRLKELERAIDHVRRMLTETAHPASLESEPELHAQMDALIAEHARVQRQRHKEGR